jgi:hypothetical protein
VTFEYFSSFFYFLWLFVIFFTFVSFCNFWLFFVTFFYFCYFLLLFITFCYFLLLFVIFDSFLFFTFCDFFKNFLLLFVTSLTFCNILLHKSHLGPNFVIGAKENLGPFPLLRPKVLAPNLCHVDRHVGCEKFGSSPNVKPLGPF